jgi:ribosomal-protein-alanine N-acetyltransferase
MSEKTLELRTERLLLRPFRQDDVDDVYAYATDPEWARYNQPVPQPYTRRHAEEFVESCVLADPSVHVEFALVLSGRVVGSVRLSFPDEGPTGLGYSLAREHWGKGLVPEALRAIFDWVFATRYVEEIRTRADERNRRSWRVMEKLGMTREALVRGKRIARDGPADEVIYRLLREEWEASANL